MKTAKTFLKKINFLASAVLFMSTFALPLLRPIIAHATPPISISGGSNVSGVINDQIDITDLLISGGSDGDNVSVNLFVPEGTLSFGDSTDLTFVGSSSGNNLQFSGTKANINAALLTLSYQTSVKGSFTLQMTLTDEYHAYNPANGHIYHVESVDGVISAANARTAAASILDDFGNTGYLATITSAQENQFIADRLGLNSFSWIGASDLDEEGNWVWDQGPEAGTQFWQGVSHSGHVVDNKYNNWDSSEPNNSDDNENCAGFLYDRASWNDFNCDDGKESFIVEFGAATPIAVPSKTLTINVSYPNGDDVTINSCAELVTWLGDSANNRYDNVTLGSSNIDCEDAEIDPGFATGDESGPYNFRGTFNGNNKTISNFTLVDGEYGYGFGLFGQTQDAEIYDLTLDNLSIDDSNDCTGALVGRAINSNITTVTVSNSSITSTGDGTGVIAGCIVSGDEYPNGDNNLTSSASIDNGVSGGSDEDGGTGGLVGFVNSIGQDSTVDISNNSVTNFGSEALANVGGGVGSARVESGSLTFSNNTVDTEMGAYANVSGGIGYLYSYDGATNTIDGNDSTGGVGCLYGDVGGIIGYGEFDEDTTTNITNNSSSIEIGCDGENSYALGGLVGYISTSYADQVNIQGNSATGEVSGNDEAGGLIGYIDNYASNMDISGNLAEGDVQSQYYTGGFAGYIYNEGDSDAIFSSTMTISQNQASGNVSGDYEIGGFIGEIDNEYCADLTIDQVLATGSVSSVGDGGGLIGDFYNYSYGCDSAIHLTNSYAFNDVSGEDSIGGLIGYLDSYSDDSETNSTISIDRTYASGTVTGTDDYVGGLVGYVDYLNEEGTNINISNSFVHEAIDYDSSVYYGAVFGYFDAGESSGQLSLSNLSYDQTFANAETDLPCSTTDGLDDLNCAPVNTDGNDNSHYAGNNSNEPMHGWDFADTWGNSVEINEDYPCLQFQSIACTAAEDGDDDGIPTETEQNGPNNGDANNDGAPDASEKFVSSFVSGKTGKYVVVETSCTINSGISLVSESLTKKDSTFDYPAGLVNFRGNSCGDNGVVVTINLFFYGDYPASKYTLRKWNSSTGTYTTIDGTKTNLTIGGQSVLKVTYTVTDGGSLDLDGVADGSITDPIGLGAVTVAAPDTGFGGSL